ncbi:MAG: ATP-binding protein [Candidatus Omnitrophota bacterium]|nr:ATP-binding protein [Candidatus Omnitrophota bacterium]
MFIEPVFGKKFFGREEVLATLQKRVTALKGGYRQNLALAGPMLAGKSSILRHFLMELKDSEIIPLYVEMGEDDFSLFCNRFMATLLYRYLKTGWGKAEGDFKALKKTCRQLIPETVRCMDKVEKALKNKKAEIAYETLLFLTSVFKTETGKSCIVILDEFHNLSNFRLKRPFLTFGKFIMIQKNTMYIVSSSQKTLLKEILSRKLSLLFGNFEILEIYGFDNQTARSFVSERISDGPSCRKIKDYLIQVSQGSPFYLEVLADRFSELMRRRGGGCDPVECLLDDFADLLYKSEGILNQYFTNNLNFFLEKKSRKKFIPVLLSLARGRSTIKAILDDLERADRDLGAKLQKLQDMDMVYNSGVFYKISDKLFEYWLKHVYALKSRAVIDEMDIKYLEFKACVENDYKKFCEFRSKGVEAVIRDLFKCFKNEKVKVSMNCRKMPLFDRVESRALSKNLFEVTGTVANREWVCHVKQGDIADEHDIFELWGLKSEEGKTKVARKIFVPLKGIEQNAFLLAKEQNVWVWDIQQLNKILRLYGKFELVI